MSTMDEDEMFAAIVDGFGDETLESLVLEANDYGSMSQVRLMRNFFAVKQDLLDRGVLLHPIQEDDIDKQAQYYGMLQELRKRGMA